ncbi:MAG: prepilin-type N-terminal cleavage/methylation domain-containing protein [Planctomycetaceae bacterium]|jgi:general secretion pathway protein I|nr:prepilin-type N-terminal cleavage/methylation domain-containing protein [Planctomycetaceae bacterium]MDG2391597.1 prepilin-type N-terminal cleavage/methylation domain-containing protein [Planctomycetaceae bacterium]
MKQNTTRKDKPRSGFTLFEVVIAVAILLGSITALFQLLTLGHRSLTQAQFRTDAVLLADLKMNEAVAGIITLQSTSEDESEDYPGWLWSLTVDDAGVDDLLQVTITVRRDATSVAAEHEYSATRFIRDPQIFLDAALGEES